MRTAGRIMWKSFLLAWVCATWLSTVAVLAQHAPSLVSIPIHASVCTALGMPVKSPDNQACVDGIPMETRYLLTMVGQSEIRMKPDNGEIHLDGFTASARIIPVKPVAGDVTLGGRRLSVDGKHNLATLCRVFK